MAKTPIEHFWEEIEGSDDFDYAYNMLLEAVARCEGLDIDNLDAKVEHSIMEAVEKAFWDGKEVFIKEFNSEINRRLPDGWLERLGGKR